ncbi:hypothetical protein NM688_g5427 [Phlebia brevispora]|uniref:Uncharacterized protein n=1 Tax=Phlebia brevispora TaxID=194682 RepID=A0ACC1SW07_9APHY|nr:hypothetical protein NM688_g5427 [Phlebia brevispora]
MTQWLSHQEAMDHFAVYIEWFKNDEYKPETSFDSEPLLADDPVESEPPIPSPNTSSSSSLSYHVSQALQHLIALQSIPATRLIDEHHTSQFLLVLTTFLWAQGSSIIPYRFDGFDLYKYMIVDLPEIPELDDDKRNLPI